MQDRTDSFGYWLRRRRKALDLTQEALAQQVCCSGFTIRKIEADERRPSRRLAERLAASLAVPEEERRDFLDAARALHATNRLRLEPLPVGADTPAASIHSQPDSTIGATSDATPFVGRNNEYGLLIGLIARLTIGAGYTVLIEGEPGIGKSRLLRELARYVHAQELPTLATNCYEIERAMPYQPVIDLVTRALDRVSAATLRTLAPVSLAELAALVPEVGERVPELPQLSNDFPEARQARLSRAVDQLLEASRGGRPAVLMVDDIQWADDASAQVLHYLARHAAQRPMLVIYAYRDEAVESDERFAQLIESLRREANARRVSLARLGYADTESIVAALADANLGSPGLAERLYRETEGNPFFLMSILQSLSEGETQLEPRASGAPGLLPDALRAAVRVRLAHVPKVIRLLLDTAAVLGRRFDFDTLLDVTREPEAPLLDAVEALVKRRLLREEPEGGVYDFSHDKLREVVYRDIGGARRRLLHKSVAEALERRGEVTTHERDAQLAEHYERAHVWPKALLYLGMAADHSQKLFAMREALQWFDRAVALLQAHPEAATQTQQLALYERRGAARAQAGLTEGAVADFQRVIDAARALGEHEHARDVLIQLGMAHRRADAYEQAIAYLDEALTASRAMDDERRVADTLYHLGTVAWSNGRNALAIVHHQQAVDICERLRLTDLTAVQAFHGRGEAYFANAEPAAAIVSFSRSLDLARGIGDRSYESENLMMIGWACTGHMGLADYPRALAHFDTALAIARAADLQWHLGPTLIGRANVKVALGKFGEAWADLNEALPRLETLKLVRYQIMAHDALGCLFLDLNLFEQASQHFDRGLQLARDAGIMYWRPRLEANLVIAQLRLGIPVDQAALQTARQYSQDHSEVWLTLRCLEALAESALTNSDADGCIVYADQLLSLAARGDLRGVIGQAHRLRGLAWLAVNAYESAQKELTLAVTLAEQIGQVRLAWECHQALARTAAALGDSSAKNSQQARMLAAQVTENLRGSDLTANWQADR